MQKKNVSLSDLTQRLNNINFSENKNISDYVYKELVIMNLRIDSPKDFLNKEELHFPVTDKLPREKNKVYGNKDLKYYCDLLNRHLHVGVITGDNLVGWIMGFVVYKDYILVVTRFEKDTYNKYYKHAFDKISGGLCTVILNQDKIIDKEKWVKDFR